MNVAGRPVVIEGGQRYWRRRANRRVRKARFTRSLRRWSVVALALLIVGVALFQAGVYAVEAIKGGGSLAVERIEIEGATRGGRESIRTRLAPLIGRNIVDLDLDEVAGVAAGDPWVLSASVKRVLPGTLHVTVAERHPAALAMIRGEAHVVDTGGYLVGRLEPGPLRHLPVLSGLDGYDKEGLGEVLARGVRAVARLHQSAGAWVGEVAEIDLSLPDRIVVRTVDPGPAILLDPDQVERNLNRYLELRRELARRIGPLEYVDLRWQDRIAALPAPEELPAMEGG
jgi:cell division protein FtsQ